MKKQEFKKSEERLSNLWYNFKYSNFQIIQVPEREEEEREMENLFEQIMKENSPISQRKFTLRKSRKLRVSNKVDPRKHTPRNIIIS